MVNSKAENNTNTNINMQLEEQEKEEEEEEKLKMFRYGSEVEVTSDDEGFTGAWYRATVLESPYHSQKPTSSPGSPASAAKKKRRNNKRCALVQYHNLLTDDGTKPLTEVVNFAFIRPLPPSDDNDSNKKKEAAVLFEENDVVDAFYNDGWWTGVVCRVFEARGGTANRRFWVYYDSPPDVFEFDSKDLRPHWEWIHGNWVLPKKHKQKPTGSHFSAGRTVEIQIDHENLRDVWVPATVLKDLNDKFLVKHKSCSNGDEAGLLKTTVDKLHIRPVPPSSSDIDFEMLERIEATCDSGWRSGLITNVLPGRRYEVVFKGTNETKEVCHSDLRPYLEWNDGNWGTGYKKSSMAQKNQDQAGQEKNGANISDMNLNLGSSCTIRNFVKKRTPRSSLKNLMKQPNNWSEALSPMSRKAKLPAIRSNSRPSRPNKGYFNSKDSESLRLCGTVQPRKRPLGTGVQSSRKSGTGNDLSPEYESPLGGNKNNKPETGQSDTATTRKRKGRPRKSAVKMPKSEGTEGTSKDVAGTLACASIGIIGELGNPDSVVSNAEVITGSQPLIKEGNYDSSAVVEARKQNGGKKSQKRKRGRPCKLDIRIPTSPEAGLSSKNAVGVSGTLSKTKEGKMAVSGLSNNSSDDNMTLLSLFGCMDSPVGRKESKVLPGKEVEQHSEAAGMQEVEQPCEAAGMQVEAAEQHQPVNSACDTVPFLKSSPLWNTLESMEVFKALPQKPHFRPLSKCKEEYREGNAIGMMVTYSSIVEKVPTLKLDDPKSIFSSILEGLLDLENHGFDVNALRGRINDMLRLKDQQLQLRDEIKDAEAKLSQLTHDGKEFDTEISEIEKEISCLQQKLLHAKSKKENALVEMSRLHSQVEAVNANIGNSLLEFERLARTPF